MIYNRYMSEIAKSPYNGYTMYRVFHKKEKRYFAVLVSPNHRTTIASAKYVLETHLGRKLKDGYQAHHKDENKTNDVISNLEEKLKEAHIRDHNEDKVRKCVVLDCPVCGKEFTVEYRQTHWVKKKGTRTACSRSCGMKPSKTSEVQIIKKEVYLSRFASAVAGPSS
jgi:hypothetical protein